MTVCSERAATCGAANAESVERPMAGLPAASAMPRAAEMPTRSPAKLPGPTVTAMRSSPANSQRAASITRAISGMMASAWPRCMPSDSLERIAPALESRTAAAQAPSAGSMARTRIDEDAPGRYFSWRMILSENRFPLFGIKRFAARANLDRANLGHVRHEVAQQILDAVLERCRGGRADRAGAFHCEIDHALLVAAERDVAAIVRDSGAHTGLDQLLDGRDRVGISRLEEFAGLIVFGAGAFGNDRRAGHEMLHDDAENRGLELWPVAVRFGHGDEVRSEEHAADSVNVEQAFRQWRLRRLAPVAHFERAGVEHGAAGQKLQCRRVRRGFGLNEHGTSPGAFGQRSMSHRWAFAPARSMTPIA